MLNDKLRSLVYSLGYNKSERKPNSPLSKEYNPTKALDSLSSHLNILKSAAYSGRNSLDSKDYIVQKDPYNAVHKVQFEENIRAEPMTKATLMKQMNFLFGKGIKTVLDTMDDDFDTTELKQEAVSKIMSNQEYKNAKKLVDKINRRVNFRYNAKIGAFNAKAFGRSGLLKEYVDSPDGHPTSLYPLSSKLLGNVFCDKRNPGRICYIEYNSSDVSDLNNKVYYEPEDLIYFTNFDYNISPNTLGYGLSDIESIKDIAETNRVLNEEDFKEWARAHWAGQLILSLPNMQNSTEIENLLSNFEPGKPLATTSDINAQLVQIATNLKDGIELNVENDRRMLRATNTPSPLFFEDITNRATVQFILHAFKETHIEQERIWFKDIIEKQWIYPIWAQELGKEPEEMEELDAKLTIEFIDYTFDTFEQKVAVWLPIAQAGYISIERFLELIGHPELAEEYKTIKKELLQQRMEYAESLGFGQPQFNKFGQGNKVKKDETANQMSSGGGDSKDFGGSEL